MKFASEKFINQLKLHPYFRLKEKLRGDSFKVLLLHESRSVNNEVAFTPSLKVFYIFFCVGSNKVMNGEEPKENILHSSTKQNFGFNIVVYFLWNLTG